MTWVIDAAHSQATFSVRHLMITTVKGQFKIISGQLHIDEQNPANSWVEAEADVASIDTRDANRDAHLRSPDFFDAEQFPKITFKSTKVERVSGEDFKVTCDLTMHGVTKQVTLDGEYTGQIKDTYGNLRAGMSAKATINRKDFGLNWNVALESGGVMVSEHVKIEIDLSTINKAETTEAAANA
ncbi:MAG TPA: YceI family protein [Ktedonobacteraceae bacterium]|nr:YceI family protein [Ktedonobacteraceae bacterium]